MFSTTLSECLFVWWCWNSLRIIWGKREDSNWLVETIIGRSIRWVWLIKEMSGNSTSSLLYHILIKYTKLPSIHNCKSKIKTMNIGNRSSKKVTQGCRHLIFNSKKNLKKKRSLMHQSKIRSKITSSTLSTTRPGFYSWPFGTA